jgi:hypothetical protein
LPFHRIASSFTFSACLQTFPAHCPSHGLPRLPQCFAKCVTRPGPSLSGSEERCLTQCMQLYMAAFDKISQTYVSRISKEGRKQ